MIVLVVLLVACVPVKEKRSAEKDAKYHYLLGATSLSEQNPSEALKEFLQAENSATMTRNTTTTWGRST
jgi:hypothetical protein